MNPGESRELKLMPFEAVRDLINPPADAVLTVAVTRLDGPDGRAVYDIGMDGDSALGPEVFVSREAEGARMPVENFAGSPILPR